MKINREKFYFACANAGMSVSTVLKKAGLSSSVLTRINQNKNVAVLTIGKLAIALGVKAEELAE